MRCSSIALALGVAGLGLLVSSNNAQAATFYVNRAWTDGTNNASLTGTVDIPVGNYTITGNNY